MRVHTRTRDVNAMVFTIYKFVYVHALAHMHPLTCYIYSVVIIYE